MAALMDLPERPTAVFCGSDILAAGAIKYCAEVGIFVPRDVSIVGFDNLEIAELTTPELTTLDVPARDMGRLAADYVLASPVQRKHLKERELPIRLVVRESSGPAPKWRLSGPRSFEAEIPNPEPFLGERDPRATG